MLESGKHMHPVVFLLVFALFNAGCAVKKHGLSVGGLYSITDGEGDFKVAKVLVLDENAVHIRVYKNRFRSRPQTVDPSALTLGRLDDEGGFGIGHLPSSRESFMNSQPVFIQQSSVTEDELDGYNMWKEASGGVWK